MNLYPAWWRKNFLVAELLVAALASVMLVIWWTKFGGANTLNAMVQGNRGQLYGTLASLFGSLLGFAITALSIVLGFSSSERFTILRNSKYYKQLWDVFTSAIRVLGFTTVAWLVALFFDRETAQKPWLFVCCLAFSFLASLRVARCIWVLERIVEVITAGPTST